MNQEYLRRIREDLDPALVEFVQELPARTPLAASRIWHDYNDSRGYYGSLAVFRYALKHAGMDRLPNGKMYRS